MNLWQQYIRPTSILEAITALTSAPGPTLPLAGGTDIMLDLQQGRHSPVHTIVDLTEIPEMKLIETRDDRLFIGAGVPLSTAARQHPRSESTPTQRPWSWHGRKPSHPR